MQSQYEIGGESWGYWFFAKELREGSGFVISGRSPLYTLYLQLFYWLEYPYNVSVEWFFTSLITSFSLYLLLNLKLSRVYSIIAVILWLPFIRYCEPPVQSLALATSCIAFVLRSKISTSRDVDTRVLLSISYALLIMAYMFRVTYILLLFAVLFYDIWTIYKSSRIKEFLLSVKIVKSDLLLIVVLIFFTTSLLFLSDHPWNNAWFATSDWFTGEKHTSLRDANFLQSMGIKYTYLNPDVKDFYFINHELFYGATTMWEAMGNNFTFVVEQWWRNINDLFIIISNMNIFTLILKKIPFIGALIGVMVMLYGSMQSIRNDKEFLVFLVGTILLIGVTIIGMPKGRYLVPAIPFLVLSVYWYGLKLNNTLFSTIIRLKKYYNTMFLIVFVCLLLIMLFIIDQSLFIKNLQLKGIYIDILYMFFPALIMGSLLMLVLMVIPHRKLNHPMTSWSASILIYLTLSLSFLPAIKNWKSVFINKEEDYFSLKKSYASIKEVGKGCRTIMTHESNIFPLIFDHGGNQPEIVDILEIPPFGELKNSEYSGLYPERVDCLFISTSLDGSNSRYMNYIKPYEKELMFAGAELHDIKNYGRAVVLTSY